MKLRQSEKIFKRHYVADKGNYWNGYTMNTIVRFTKFWRNHRLLKAERVIEKHFRRVNSPKSAKMLKHINNNL